MRLTVSPADLLPRAGRLQLLALDSPRSLAHGAPPPWSELVAAAWLAWWVTLISLATHWLQCPISQAELLLLLHLVAMWEGQACVPLPGEEGEPPWVGSWDTPHCLDLPPGRTLGPPAQGVGGGGW